MDEVGEVVWMARGAWVSLSLRATCELGIVDVLDAPRSLTDIAERTSTDPQTLGRLLRVLVDIGLVAVDDDHYAARRSTTDRAPEWGPQPRVDADGDSQLDGLATSRGRDASRRRRLRGTERHDPLGPTGGPP